MSAAILVLYGMLFGAMLSSVITRRDVKKMANIVDRLSVMSKMQSAREAIYLACLKKILAALTGAPKTHLTAYLIDEILNATRDADKVDEGKPVGPRKEPEVVSRERA